MKTMLKQLAGLTALSMALIAASPPTRRTPTPASTSARRRPRA